MRLIDADAFERSVMFDKNINDMQDVIYALRDFPSAQPEVLACGSGELNAYSERKKGFWFALEKGDKGYSAGDFKCSVCGKPNASFYIKPNFCPNCGADMRGEGNDG